MEPIKCINCKKRPATRWGNHLCPPCTEIVLELCIEKLEEDIEDEG